MSQIRRVPRYGAGTRGKSQSRPPKRRQNRNVRHKPQGWSMKLGAWAHARLREAQYESVSRKVIQGAIIGMVALMVIGLSVAFGVFEKTGAFISEKSANATRYAGLSVHHVEITGFTGHNITDGQKAEVAAIAGIPNNEIMFNLSPNEIRDRIMVLPWVENVMVRRLWPDNVQILVKPREANAVWQENGTLQYMDAQGRKLGPADPQKVKGLPLVIGQNAGPHASELFAELERHSEVSKHVYAMIRIADRRWNLRLKGGGEVLLPEDNTEQALDQLEKLHQQYQILDRDFARLDVRKTGAIIIRPKAEANGSNIQNT